MRLQAAIAAREQTRATLPPPGSRAGVPADLIWPADRIGPQLHIGSSTLSPLRFRKVRMDGGDLENRRKNLPVGGLFTATLADGPDGPTSAFMELIREAARNRSTEGLSRTVGVTWWRLAPDPTAAILAIESLDAFSRITRLYPYLGGTEMDAEAIARDGFAGVHLTATAAAAAAAARHEGLETWQESEQTHWVTWAFVGAPERLDPPAWALDAQAREGEIARGLAPECAGAPPPKPGTHRYWLGGGYAGQWFDARPLSARGRASARDIVGRDNEGKTTRMQAAAWATILEDIVVAHNLEGPDGGPLALGKGGAEWFQAALLRATKEAYTLGNRMNHWREYG